ncbi:TPA: molecular chaperone [Serratia marcescens]
MQMKYVAGAGIALCLMSMTCQAFQLGGLRLVLNEEQKNTSISVIGGKDDPVYLIHSRITRTPDGEGTVPNFLVTPPLFRLDKNATGMVRVSLLNAQGLPTNQESVFYLKVSGIPSTNPLERGNGTGFTGGQVIFGTGSVIKFFYRPRGMPAPTLATYQSVTYSRVPGGVLITNPTPYHITFGPTRVDGKLLAFNKTTQPVMLPPFGKQVYITSSPQKKQITWSMIDDNGNKQKGTSLIR